MTRKTSAFRFALVLGLALLVLAPSALAAKGGIKGRNAPTGSFRLVLLDSTDGLAHHGQRVTFEISNDVQWPFVEVACHQNGTQVYLATVGFYAGYPWTQEFTLSGWAWPSGGADCIARLYNDDGGAGTTLATLSFSVHQ